MWFSVVLVLRNGQELPRLILQVCFLFVFFLQNAYSKCVRINVCVLHMLCVAGVRLTARRR